MRILFHFGRVLRSGKVAWIVFLPCLWLLWHQPEMTETLQTCWPLGLPPLCVLVCLCDISFHATWLWSWSFILLLFDRNLTWIFHFGRMLWCRNLVIGKIFYFGRVFRSWKRIAITWIWWLFGLPRNRCYLPLSWVPCLDIGPSQVPAKSL